MVSLRGWMPNKNDLAMAAGAAVSGTVTGYLQGVLPINLEFIPGTTEFIVGTAMGKFLLKKGMGRSFCKGIQLAGLSHMIASFIPQFAGTIGTQPIPAKATLQVDGYKHSQWFGASPALYQKRNPIASVTETKVAPRGTRNLIGKQPYIKV